MSPMTSMLIYAQMGLGIVLIAGILMQSSAAGLGAAFGGGDVDGGFHVRRGPERFMFIATSVVAIAFVIVSFLTFLYA